MSALESNTEQEPVTKNFELTSFDPVIEEELPEDEVSLVPQITQEDVEQARREGIKLGVEQGFEAGEKKAREELEKVFAEAAKENDAAVDKMFQQLAGHLERVFVIQQQGYDQQTEQLLRLTRQVWQRLLPVYTSKYGADEVVDVVQKCLALAQEGGQISVRYAAQDKDKLLKMLAPMQKMYAERHDVVFQPDEDLHSGDVSMLWENGGASRTSEELMQAVNNLVDEAVEQFHLQKEKDTAAIAATSVEAVPETIREPASDLEATSPNEHSSDQGVVAPDAQAEASPAAETASAEKENSVPEVDSSEQTSSTS